MRRRLLKLPRKTKVFLLILFDVTMLSLAFVAAHILHFGNIPHALQALQWPLLFFILPVSILTFHLLGVYRSLLRFTSAKTLAETLVGCSISAVLLWMMSAFFTPQLSWVIIANYLLVSGGLTVCGRFILRAYFRADIAISGTPVLIYGARDLGRQLLTSLQQGSQFHPVGILDETSTHTGSTIGGVKVHSPAKLEHLLETTGAKIVFIAMSEVSRQAQKDLAQILKTTAVEIQRIPAVTDVLSGRAKITDFKEVRIEDLLGRDPVPAVPHLMEATTGGKSVLITGAGGSIGSEICRQVLTTAPDTLVLVEQSEFALFTLEQELNQTLAELERPTRLVPVLGNVGDQSRMEDTLSRFDVDTVFHAAAFKHVPMLEENVIAAVDNNVFGTEAIVAASVKAGISSFTMVSTDKAVRPTNVMGATKRLAELICQAHADNQEETTISMVRFGNVLGSSGSVIPFFRDQIANGGPVTVTHEDITRYFMTIPEASQLVIQSSGMATGGDVFVLDMGEPIKILDLAQSMIRLSGYSPILTTAKSHNTSSTADEIEIVFSGLRPGEKLYEELLIDANAKTTAHPRIKKANENMLGMSELNKCLTELRSCIDNRDSTQALTILTQLPLEFSQKANSCSK